MQPKPIGVLHIPYDENSSFIKGPAKAPAKIDEILMSGSLNKSCENGVLLEWNENIYTLPELPMLEQESFNTNIELAVSKAISQGYQVLSLGGDHSITYPIVKGVYQHYGAVNIIHFDAHPDLYDVFKGNRYSNACPFARIMEENLAKSLHQYGIRTLNEHQSQQAKRFKVNVNTMLDWPCEVPDFEGPVYLSIDIDALDPAFAPGVSHREPGGLSTRDIINFIHKIKAPIVGIDIVEYNPDKDIDDMTAYVAAKLVKEAAGIMLASEQ